MSLFSSFVRPRPAAWLFFIAAMATTLSLGTWQVHRLAWKEGLIADIKHAQESTALAAMPQTEAELKALDFYPITLHGHWVKGTEFDITPRFFHSTLGYFIVSPFMLKDGRTLLVNRGWVPTAKKDLSTRPKTAVSGAATIHGMIRYGAERSWATPQSEPAKNLWFGRDIDAMAAYAKLPNPVPAMVDLIGPQDASILPVPSDGTIRLRNDHLSYIITWYGIALGVFVIFLTYHRKRR